MDKNTIKKYKKEFDAWLNDQDVFYRYKKEDFHKDIGWSKLTESANFFSSNCIYILNDEFVDFRKAIADGKIIEVYTLVKQHKTNPFLDEFKWKKLVNFKSLNIELSSYPFDKNVKYRIVEN